MYYPIRNNTICLTQKPILNYSIKNMLYKHNSNKIPVPL